LVKIKIKKIKDINSNYKRLIKDEKPKDHLVIEKMETIVLKNDDDPEIRFDSLKKFEKDDGKILKVS